MPFQSEKQRRFLWANDPKIAHAWAHGKSSVTGKKEKTARKLKQSGKRKSKRGSRR
jgi:hypothetical protein